MSYLPSTDAKQFRKETWELVGWCIGFIVALGIVVYFTDNVVVVVGG